MGKLFADNPYYVEHETQMRHLHQLIAAGKGDTDEADALRDAMDVTWRHLTSEEVERINVLSADLYVLHGAEIRETQAA